MIRKILLIFLISLLLSSCTKNSTEEITFSSWGSVTETKIMEDVIADFEKKNPNIKINFLHIPQNYFQKLHLLFASACEPDVVFINNLYLPFYADRLEILEEIINIDDFYPQSIEALSQDGRLYAIPRDISNFVLYYNKNIIKDNISNNWDFNQFYNYLKKYTNENYYGISFERDIFYAQPYIMTLGYEKGIDFYKNLEGKYAPTPAQVGSYTLAHMFLNEKLAFYMSGRWLYPKISETAKFPFGVVIFPGTVSADASGWAIPKNSKHKESAKLFVKYLSSKDSIEKFTETGLIVPARIDASKKLDNNAERAFLDAIKHSKPVKYDKKFPKQRDKINKTLFN